MAETAKIQTLHDNDTGEAIAPRTDIKALSGEGEAGQIVGFTEDNKIGAMDMQPNVPAFGYNALDNAYWADRARIINQLGVSGKISTPGYFIDRWILESGTVELTDGGLLLDGTIAQKLEFAPGVADYPEALSEEGPVQAEYDAGTKTMYVRAAGKTLLGAQLAPLGCDLGRLDGGRWVLNAPPPNYQQELAKCQRYQEWIYYEGRPLYSTSGYTVDFTIPFKVLKAKRPTCTIYDITNQAGHISYYSGNQWVNNVEAHVNAVDGYSSAGSAWAARALTASNALNAAYPIVFRVFADANL